MSRRIKETQEGRFPMNLSEMCRTPLSHNDRVSGGCQISHFSTFTFSFCFHSTLICLSPFFFLSFSNSSLCFGHARASLSLSFTHGSGFGSGTRWLQLQKVRISDRLSASPSTSPLSRLTKGQRSQRHTIRAKNKPKSGFRLITLEAD